MKFNLDGRKLAVLMVTSGMNQKELATKAGISRATLSNASNGHGCLAKTACQLAYALNVPLSEITKE